MNEWWPCLQLFFCVSCWAVHVAALFMHFSVTFFRAWGGGEQLWKFLFHCNADFCAVPDENRIDKRAGLIVQEFKSLAFSADYQPGAKRKVFNCAHFSSSLNTFVTLAVIVLLLFCDLLCCFGRQCYDSFDLLMPFTCIWYSLWRAYCGAMN